METFFFSEEEKCKNLLSALWMSLWFYGGRVSCVTKPSLQGIMFPSDDVFNNKQSSRTDAQEVMINFN